jgi:hypothetical protein
MFLLRLALGLALLAPCVGLAQPSDVPAPSAPAEAEALTPPPLVSAPQEPGDAPPPAALFPRRLEPTPPRGPGLLAGRLMLELLAGAVGGAGIGAAGVLVGASLISNACNNDDSLDCIVPLVMVGGAGALLGVPLGVYGAGNLLQGRGQFWPALIGTVAGAGAGLVGGLASGNDAALIIGLSAGPVLGAILGYELSHSVSWIPGVKRPGRTQAHLSVLPSLAAVPGGGVLGGLTGRF